jgi:hypothetical protein
MCRVGGAELHSTGALLGGMVSQELIKVTLSKLSHRPAPNYQWHLHVTESSLYAAPSVNKSGCLTCRTHTVPDRACNVTRTSGANCPVCTGGRRLPHEPHGQYGHSHSVLERNYELVSSIDVAASMTTTRALSPSVHVNTSCRQ